MKLREQFGNVMLSQMHNSNCEKIAEEFAIGFAIWLSENNYEGVCNFGGKIVSELLQEYKKEKNL
jgi:hypothetical protein